MLCCGSDGGISALLALERLYAQDPLPPIARVLEPLNLPGQTKEMHSFGRLIVFHDSLPESFKHTADNVIEDSTRSMVPFFRKLNEMNGRYVSFILVTLCERACILWLPVVAWKVISVLRLLS